MFTKAGDNMKKNKPRTRKFTSNKYGKQIHIGFSTLEFANMEDCEQVKVTATKDKIIIEKIKEER